MSSPPSPKPSVKAVKKKAFSCEQCRHRKVRCGGEQPSCRRCVVRNDTCQYRLPPTISYTQKLENKVTELQALVSKLQTPEPEKTTETFSKVSQPPQKLPSRGSMPDILGTFGGLKCDDKGGITYHGATSFFQLPSPATQGEAAKGINRIPREILEGGRRKERLVNNAWQQRALETFSETPVSIVLLDQSVAVTLIYLGAVSISFRRPLVLDPTAVQLRIPTSVHS